MYENTTKGTELRRPVEDILKYLASAIFSTLLSTSSELKKNSKITQKMMYILHVMPNNELNLKAPIFLNRENGMRTMKVYRVAEMI